MSANPYIIWDWNGTLLDDVRAAVGALNRMLAVRGLPPTTLDFYRARFGFPVRPFYAAVGLDLAREDWDGICTDFHRFIADEPDQHLRPDAKDALAAVRAAGCGQSILSALRQDLLTRDTAREGVTGWLDEIYGVDNLDGATKLSRGHDLVARLRATGRLRDGQPLFFVGDTLHDAEAAAEFGASAVLISTGHQAAERLATAGCPVVASPTAAVRQILDGRTQ